MAEWDPLLPPDQAVAAFSAKGYEIGWGWQDVWQERHGAVFTVAKATRLDLLQDIRRAVDQAQRNGMTFEQFRRELTPILQSYGWWGKQLMVDPLDGVEKLVQLGSPRRLRTIFDTNMRTSRAAGQWRRIQSLKARRPFLRYVAVMDRRTRPLHASWHGTILPVDDPWWQTHFPPNGWFCRCSTQQLSAYDMKQLGFTVSDRPPLDERNYVNKRTGEVTKLPSGIDPGWAYNVGASPLQAMVPAPKDGAPLPLPARLTGLPPLPEPAERPASRLLGRSIDERAAVEAFLAEFGATRDQVVVFTDPIGEPVAIGPSFFYRPDGATKLVAGDRRDAILLLADALRNPDEIWWQWEEVATDFNDKSKREWRLRRRYVARFLVGTKRKRMVVVLDVGKDGWAGVSGFPAERDTYLDTIRGGTLAYRRP